MEGKIRERDAEKERLKEGERNRSADWGEESDFICTEVCSQTVIVITNLVRGK